MPDDAVRRVLMTGDTVGGVWTFTLELARQLGSRGIEVLLATMGGEPSLDQREEVSEIPNLRFVPSSYKLEWMDEPWDDVEASGAWLLDLRRQFAPDVVHLNSFGHGALHFEAPVVLTAHSCVLSWWDAAKPEPLPSRWNRYRLQVETSIKGADVLTAPSQAMLDTIMENYGPDLPPARVVPNGRCAERFRPSVKEPLILAAGRLWDEGKNVAALSKVAPSIPWPIYLAGETRAPSDGAANVERSLGSGTGCEGSDEEVRGERADLGLVLARRDAAGQSASASCRPLGRLTPAALARWYGRASIYAHPARYEPFGLCVLEAALSGCALVLGDIASLREIWRDAAIFVPPDDTNALQSAINNLIQRPSLRDEMALRATARARSFTADRMAQTYAEIYASQAGMRRMACGL
ncbi:MAG TPA: glycosyltransferase family 4 protein [Bryobacteraceae bacterium]|nr:glycosyltransferase family 4 protein [Bryobacteraceae bacterium]